MNTSFEWNGATFAVAEETVGVAVRSQYVLYLLYPAPTDLQFRLGLDYGVFLATVTVRDGDPGFVMPSPDAPAADIHAFYERYETLPGSFHTAWTTARAQQMTSANTPDKQPDIDPKDSASSPSDASATTSSPPLTDDLSASLEAVSD
jgi:hypothetical protein